MTQKSQELIIAGDEGSQAQTHSVNHGHKFVIFKGAPLGVLNKENLELGIGHQDVLSVKVIPADTTISATSWKSDQEEIVTIDESGKIKALAEGSATITVTITRADGDITASTKVDVTSRVPSLNGDTYEIENPDQLNWFSKLVNGKLEGITQNKGAKGISSSMPAMLSLG